MSKWLLIDGFNLIFRSFYGLPLLYRADGLPTNAILGWVRTFSTLTSSLMPTHVAVFFDSGAPTHRTEIYPEYKANRKETPKELTAQIDWIKKLTDTMGCATFCQTGVEADDLIASFALQRMETGDSVCIVSSDKDLAQIIQEGICQLLPPPTANPRLGWRRLDAAGVLEKFGVRPDQIVDYLSLLGDASDNILGVPGVGPKTAVNWLQEYGTVDEIIKKANYLDPKRFQKVIPEFAEQLKLNKELITLKTDLECKAEHDDQGQPDEFRKLLEELEMKSIKPEVIAKIFERDNGVANETRTRDPWYHKPVL